MKNLFTLLLISLLSNYTLSAQNMIEGGISDKNGEVLSTAMITFENEQHAQFNKSIQTDEYGYFIIEDLEDGQYRLVVENKDYKTITIDNFVFPRDADQILGLTMESQIATQAKKITVAQNFPEKGERIAEIYD